MDKEKILIVEDDPEIRELISLYMRMSHFDVWQAEDGEQGVDLFHKVKPDLVILDVILPKMNGVEVCKRIRGISKVPIIFLSSCSEAEDIISGLEAGGDNYITKPFDPAVLVAKVKAALRRNAYHKPESNLLKYGSLEIDWKNYGVRVNGQPIVMAAKEMQLLLLLARNPNHVFSVEQLYSQIWGPSEYGDLRTVMVHISHLRKKIEPDPSNPRYIVTVRGFGYKFQAGE